MREPKDRLRDYLKRSLLAYADDYARMPRKAAEAIAALQSEDFFSGPGWFKVLCLVRFLEEPGIQDALTRELESEFIDRRFYAALLLALLGVEDGLGVLEHSPPLSASGIEAGLALLGRATLGKLDALELERRLDHVPNARAFGL